MSKMPMDLGTLFSVKRKYRLHKLFMIAMVFLFLFSCDDGRAGKSSIDLGFEQADKSDWKRALVYFKKATKEEPDNSVAWANLGTSYLNTGEYKLAIESYNRAYSLNPKDPYISCSLSSTYNVLKEPRRAIKHADNALSVDPQYAPAMFNKAKALKILGRNEESDILIEKAVTLRREQKRFSEKIRSGIQ